MIIFPRREQLLATRGADQGAEGKTSGEVGTRGRMDWSAGLFMYIYTNMHKDNLTLQIKRPHTHTHKCTQVTFIHTSVVPS